MAGARGRTAKDEPVAEHVNQVRRLATVLRRVDLPPGPPTRCPYLDGRKARLAAAGIDPADPGLYHALMDLNFRRQGRVVYRPQCDTCTECRMLRVPSSEFLQRRSQKRCRRRNTDVTITAGPPVPSDEKHALYQRYLRERHDRQMDGTFEEFLEFLYQSPIDTIEFCYRVEGRLVGVGIADVEPLALSAVFCWFDPAEARRSIGVLNVLTIIETARRMDRPWAYLGYWVRDCRRMSYKSDYRPCEILRPDGSWERVD